MKKLLVLGAGSAGTMVANRMNRMLDRNEWQITIVDPDPVHYYQPGWLFMPFGIYTEKDVYKPRKNGTSRASCGWERTRASIATTGFTSRRSIPKSTTRARS